MVQTRVGKYRPWKRSGLLITSAKQHNLVASYDRGGFVAPRAHSCVFLSYPRPHEPGSLHLAHFSSTPEWSLETFLPQVKLITKRRLHPELSFDWWVGDKIVLYYILVFLWELCNSNILSLGLTFNLTWRLPRKSASGKSCKK